MKMWVIVHVCHPGEQEEETTASSLINWLHKSASVYLDVMFPSRPDRSTLHSSVLLCNSLRPTARTLKTYFLRVRCLLTGLFCNCRRWEGEAFQSSGSVCYCYSTLTPWMWSVPRSPLLSTPLFKFVPLSQWVRAADPHPRITTSGTGMWSEITSSSQLQMIWISFPALWIFN